MQVAFMLNHDLCNEEDIADAFTASFPLWAELGAIPSHVFTVERSVWESARWREDVRVLSQLLEVIRNGGAA